MANEKKEEKEITNIAKKTSVGHGYHYASLGDIAEQGFRIPKTKTGTDNGKDYIYYWDEEFKEWTRGAEIVIAENKSQNKAQQYGSALTYAIRYTTYMADAIACDEDKEIENVNADGTSKESKPASEKQIQYIYNLYDLDNIKKMLSHYKVETLEELTSEQASEAINHKKDGKVNNQQSA